jgi:hypothetical protein
MSFSSSRVKSLSGFDQRQNHASEARYGKNSAYAPFSIPLANFEIGF